MGHRHFIGTTILAAAAVLTVLVWLAGLAEGGRQLESEGVMRDGLTGRAPLTSQEREVLDLNADGRMDVADLIYFLRTQEGLPRVRFTAGQSRHREDAGQALVELQWDRAFDGTLFFEVAEDTTALPGEEFEPPADALAISGTEAELPVSLVDTLGRQGLRSVVLELVPGDGYEVGSPSVHHLYIEDTDSLWSGVLTQGESSVPFELEIQRSEGEAEAVFFHVPGGFVPESDPPEAGWPATDVSMSETELTVTVEDLPVPSQHSSRFPMAFTRTLTLTGSAAKDGFAFNTDVMIEGEYEEIVAPEDPAFEYLTTTRNGVFLLQRGSERFEAQRQALEQAP